MTFMVLLPGPQRSLFLCKSYRNVGLAEEGRGEESLNLRAWNTGTGHGPRWGDWGVGKPPELLGFLPAFGSLRYPNGKTVLEKNMLKI